MNKNHLNHNLQNDLTVMLGLVCVMQKMEVSEDVRNLLDKLQVKIQKTSRTFFDIINPKEELDFATLFKEIESDLNVNANGKGFLIKANKRKSEMFVENIIKNAKEAGARNLKISCGKKTIIIRDDGNGLSEENLLNLNSNKKFTTKLEGSGVGTQYLRDFCNKHKLKINFSNNFTKGCQITINTS